MQNNLEERILAAQNNTALRDDIISEYRSFISSCAKKACGRYITVRDDEMSIAMIAFDESITKYDFSKGNFLHFAAILIKSRLIDFMRKEYKHSGEVAFSQLSQVDEQGNIKEFEIEDRSTCISDAKYEMEAVEQELLRYGISFFELPKSTPKSKKTKKDCFLVIGHILHSPIILSGIKEKGMLPIKTVTEQVKVNKKLLERHRAYIIAAIVILSGEYATLSEYFKEGKEV